MSHLKLTRIEIQGFRRFREPFALDLVSPSGEPLDYVVLAGPNGCGKTTVLEAILLALGREELITRATAPEARLSTARVLLDDDTSIRAVIRDLSEGTDYSVERTATTISAYRSQSGGERVLYRREELRDKLALLETEYLSSCRVPARAGPIQDTIRGQAPEDTEANRILRFKHRVRQQQGRRVPDYEGPEPFDQVWMKRLNDFWCHFRNDQTRLKMTLMDPSNLDVSEWDLFLYEGNRRICSVDALSSGEQEVLSVVVPFITEPFDGLLLFDEPELHLHPQWQGRVLRAIREVVPNAQVIVSSHAYDPWDDAMSWERFLLVPDDDPRAATGRRAI